MPIKSIQLIPNHEYPSIHHPTQHNPSPKKPPAEMPTQNQSPSTFIPRNSHLWFLDHSFRNSLITVHRGNIPKSEFEQQTQMTGSLYLPVTRISESHSHPQ